MRTSRVTRAHGDRGAVLVIVAAFAIVAVTMLAVVVDLGDQRQERKEVSLSTDAAALAAAALADTESDALRLAAPGELVDCDQVRVRKYEVENDEGFVWLDEVVLNYLGRNGDSQWDGCKVARTSLRAGYVLVSANEDVEYAVGPALGINGNTVAGTSVAAIDAGKGGGLRPVGICSTTESLIVTDQPGFSEMSLRDLALLGDSGYFVSLTDGGYIVDASGERSFPRIRLPIEHQKGTSCGAGGGGSGNFGKLDFGGETSESCSNVGHFCKDLKDGYYDPIANPVKGNTGNNWSGGSSDGSYASYLQNLMKLGSFWAPVIYDINSPGNNAEMSVSYFVELRMLGFCVDNSGSGSAGTAVNCQYSETGNAPDLTTYFDFEVVRMQPYAGFSVPRNFDAPTRPPRLCAVDNDMAVLGASCPQILDVEPNPGPFPDPEPAPDECVVSTLEVSWPENYFVSGQNAGQMNKDLDASFLASGACGDVVMFLVPPTDAPKQFSVSPATNGTVLKDDEIWEPGEFVVEVRNDGLTIASDSVSY